MPSELVKKIKKRLSLLASTPLLLCRPVPSPAHTLEFANLDYSSSAFSEGSFSFIHNRGSNDFQLNYATG